MTLTPELLLSALLLGLFGSGHCLVMCGGFAAALQMMQQQQALSHFARWRLVLATAAGRLTSYAITGALFGAFGAGLAGSHGAAPALLKLFAGLMLLAMALYLGRWWFGLLKLERLGQAVWRLVQPRLTGLLPLNRSDKAFLYGLGWGYLPCGLVYSALSWAIGSSSAGAGALWMLCFGVGTLPAVLLAGQSAQILLRFQQQRLVRQSLAVGLLCYAAYTIYLALNALLF